ncbi:hypothetical protein BJ508DRAFT_419779 [Ascobolus immersus RN42]|uniref:Uncharacterized protein n=1 Tax=Ascobolus immersus RN42 TaxID=1160509 RepID=A0A3N4HF26_ASCIM|nr:hypothetical protein BJ508DRAFT_419779 [Ascobolus immersus RN42]
MLPQLIGLPHFRYTPSFELTHIQAQAYKMTDPSDVIKINRDIAFMTLLNDTGVINPYNYANAPIFANCVLKNDTLSNLLPNLTPFPRCTQPELAIPAADCYYGRDVVQEIEESGLDQTRRTPNKENCVSFCNALNDGSWKKELKKCFVDGCVAATYDEKFNEPMLDFIVDRNLETSCEPFGLKGGEKEDEPKKDETKKDEGKTEGDDKKDDESAASGLGIKKGALVFALLFGSVLSGLL